ncbi:MAG: lytic transglycosylase domain-containing protein [Anaerolineae bacterium]
MNTIVQQKYPHMYRIRSPLSQEWPDSIQEEIEAPTATLLPRRMLFILTLVAGILSLFTMVVIPRLAAVADEAALNQELGGQAIGAGLSTSLAESPISPIFSPEVQFWGPQIAQWSAMYGLDPNMVATIMQIESCGDPGAVSGAGAQGLFQVMPFHFLLGEDMLNPETNAARGLNYFRERLQQTGDVFLAFAGYNGGHVAAAGNWASWSDETRRYYVWSKGIYEEASAGLAQSPTLEKWMAAGGTSLCRQAAERLGI